MTVGIRIAIREGDCIARAHDAAAGVAMIEAADQRVNIRSGIP